MIETLKDYAVKALVNTVDHLGSVTFKVNDLLDNKIDEVSASEFRISSIEQVINRSFLLDFCFRYMAYSIEWWSDMQYFSSKCCYFSLETPNMPEVYRSRGLFPTISHHKHAKIPQTLHFTRQNSSLHIFAFFLDHFFLLQIVKFSVCVQLERRCVALTVPKWNTEVAASMMKMNGITSEMLFERQLQKLHLHQSGEYTILVYIKLLGTQVIAWIVECCSCYCSYCSAVKGVLHLRSHLLGLCNGTPPSPLLPPRRKRNLVSILSVFFLFKYYMVSLLC